MSLEHTQARPVDACPDADSNAINHMHDVFSSWERRAILYCLSERDREVSLDLLVEHVAAWRHGHESPAEAGTPPDYDPDEETVTVRTNVRQLDEFDILSYDPGEETVRLRSDVQVAVNPPWDDRSHSGTAATGADRNELSDDPADGTTVT